MTNSTTLYHVDRLCLHMALYKRRYQMMEAGVPDLSSSGEDNWWKFITRDMASDHNDLKLATATPMLLWLLPCTAWLPSSRRLIPAYESRT